MEASDLPQVPLSSPVHLSSPHIHAILVEIKHVNRLIAALRQHYLSRLVSRHGWVHPYLRGFRVQPDAPPSWHPGHQPASLAYLISLRKTLQRLRYRAEHDELDRRATRSSRARIDAVLLGGSSKRLFVHAHDTDGPPAALQTTDSPPTFVTGPVELKQRTVDYFADLIRRTPRAPSAKPWMHTPSVQAIRAHTADHPFSWPQTLTPSDLRFLLHKGNACPAPGPDLWEK